MTTKEKPVSKNGKPQKTNPNFGRYELLPVKDLHSDGTYQRPISMWRVRRIVFNYPPILFQPLIIGLRKGVYYIVDGQHRKESAFELGFVEVPCMVYDTVSAAEEAKAFLFLQKYRRIITTPQSFMAEIAFNDPTAKAISELLTKHKFEIDRYDGYAMSGGRNNSIRAVSALKWTYDAGGAKLLDNLLYVLRQAWDGRAAALDRRIILGLAIFMRDNPYSVKELALKLGDQEPLGLRSAALSIRRQHGLAENQAMARVIHNVYRSARLTAKA